MPTASEVLKFAEDKVKAAGRRGLLYPIGFEPAVFRELVEDGVIYQEIADRGLQYRFTHPDRVDRKRSKKA